ncbi:glycosyltransferase [Limosilactobacillus vaginalis]|uniref:glycosyltransferase n=1 Tax=Limosilactobacillus TaxID=2742598 RepID=UPI003AAD1FFB
MSDLRKYPKFSVLMSVYKKEKPEYLDLALKSIEHQTVKPNEIILVEDGPITSELKKIIVKHKEKFGKGFKIIISQRNQGLGLSLRLGTKYVSTEWIARMDSDDYSVPDRFEKQLQIIQSTPDLAVIGGQIQEFSGNLKNIVGYRKVPTSRNKIYKFMKWRSPFNHPTVIINKNILEKVGGYVPFGNLEDYYLWLRIILSDYKTINLDKVLVKMRADEGMYSRRGYFSNITYFYALRKFLYKNTNLTWIEMLLGNVIVTLNILVPSRVRKYIYQYFLHR